MTSSISSLAYSSVEHVLPPSSSSEVSNQPVSSDLQTPVDISENASFPTRSEETFNSSMAAIHSCQRERAMQGRAPKPRYELLIQRAEQLFDASQVKAGREAVDKLMKALPHDLQRMHRDTRASITCLLQKYHDHSGAPSEKIMGEHLNWLEAASHLQRFLLKERVDLARAILANIPDDECVKLALAKRFDIMTKKLEEAATRNPELPLQPDCYKSLIALVKLLHEKKMIHFLEVHCQRLLNIQQMYSESGLDSVNMSKYILDLLEMEVNRLVDMNEPAFVKRKDSMLKMIDGHSLSYSDQARLKTLTKEKGIYLSVPHYQRFYSPLYDESTRPNYACTQAHQHDRHHQALASSKSSSKGVTSTTKTLISSASTSSVEDELYRRIDQTFRIRAGIIEENPYGPQVQDLIGWMKDLSAFNHQLFSPGMLQSVRVKMILLRAWRYFIFLRDRLISKEMNAWDRLHESPLFSKVVLPCLNMHEEKPIKNAEQCSAFLQFMDARFQEVLLDECFQEVPSSMTFIH